MALSEPLNATGLGCLYGRIFSESFVRHLHLLIFHGIPAEAPDDRSSEAAWVCLMPHTGAVTDGMNHPRALIRFDAALKLACVSSFLIFLPFPFPCLS